MTEQPPQVYQYSVKLECDQKCVKPSVHVYTNDDYETASQLAVQFLNDIRYRLIKNDYNVAPLEVKEK